MTQDLIKKMREEYAKQQEEKLIQEQVEQIKLEAEAAPAPSATNTPQAVLDRTVATIKKVNEVKASGNLQVINMSLTDDVKVNISTMDGTTAEKTLVARDYVDGGIALLNTSKANANLKVQSIDGTQHDLSTMDGSVDDKLLASLKFIEGTFETQASITTKLATKADATALATKQDTLTRTLTLVLDDGTTTNIKVG